MVYIPLFIQNKVHGVIILGTVGRKHTFEKHEIELFSTFSNITSLALENSYLFENLKETKEKAEESNNLKTAFLHNISHEIRTPLNAIIGFSALLGQPDQPPEKINEYIGIISQSNNQLLSIIEDILNISRIEVRQMSLSETWADLNEILTNLYSQYHPTALKKGLEFAIRPSFAGHDPVIVTDENKIIGILTNLLNNAFKFTLNGRIELGCNIKDAGVEFYVSDTGIGIPASEQEKIFERFYQIDKSMSKFHGGMGLGLAISAAYVEMLGGRISLNSCQGQGSTFSFVIPFKKE
jgi:signal transduction histidine kinase